MQDEQMADIGHGNKTVPARRKLAFLRYALLGLGAAFVVCAVLVTAFLALAPGDSGGTAAVPPESVTVRWSGDPGPIYDRPLATPARTRAPTPAPTPVPGPPPFENAPFRMVIDSLGVDAPVNTYGLDSNQIPQVPYNAHEVAWYNFSAQPGSGSNAVFAGHVTWSGPGVFYSLNSLGVGENIRLRGDDGTELVYSVTDSFLVDPDDPSAVSVMLGTPEDMITIITCDGSFYYTGDPIFGGDYTDRRVVQARLASATLASDPQPASEG